MRISDEVLVHPDRYDDKYDQLMFKVAFVSEMFFAGSGRPLVSYFEPFRCVAAFISVILGMVFFFCAPRSAKMAAVASMETSSYNTVRGPCYRKMRKKNNG